MLKLRFVLSEKAHFGLHQNASKMTIQIKKHGFVLTVSCLQVFGCETGVGGDLNGEWLAKFEAVLPLVAWYKL